MQNAILLIGIFATGLFSCQSNQSTENQNQIIFEQVVEQIKSLPDTVLISKDMKKNEFQVDLSEIKINAEKTSLLNGEWSVESGDIRFLNMTLESGDKVIFYDTTRASMTGWGTIRYNRAAKFYFTESGSHMYEYYVLDDNRLILTQYDYRNDDLSIKKQPEPISQEMTVNFIGKDDISLELNGQIVKLKRK